MTSHDSRRPRWLVGGKLQIGVTLHVVGYVYFYLVLFALLANFNALKTVVEVSLFSAEADDAYLAAVNRLEIFVGTFVLPLVLTFIAMCLHGMVFTRRLVGPIRRFRDHLAKASQGDLSASVNLREGDYFTELCTDVNSLLYRVRTDLLRFRGLSRELAEEAESLSESGDLSREAFVKLHAIAVASTRMRQLTDGYRLDTSEEDPGLLPTGPDVVRAAAPC